MSTEHAEDALVLHALRVAGWLSLERLASWGVTEPAPAVNRLIGADLVRLAKTPRGEMYGLTGLGTPRAEEYTTQWWAGLTPENRSTVQELLASFEQHDPELKRLITGWQGGDKETALKELGELHESVRTTVSEIGGAGPLWSSYPARLDGAAERVAKGESDYVASPLVESYHTVWHLLHRDLRLVTASRI